MLLVFDVGNTNMVIGIYKDKSLVKDWRICTDIHKTSDEYGMLIGNLLAHNNIDIKSIDDVIISSVVPNIMHSLENMVRKSFNIEPIVVGPGVKTGINIRYDNPKEVGADRIVNAVAAHDIYKRDLIILDFGTATTYCAVTKEGDYLGGCISPGVKIASDALFERAAKLPRIELEVPKSVICKNTITSMQAGILYGYIGQVEYIVRRMKREMNELGIDNPYVIATGGLANLIAKETDIIDKVDSSLTLEGLRIIYEKNKE